MCFRLYWSVNWFPAELDWLKKIQQYSFIWKLLGCNQLHKTSKQGSTFPETFIGQCFLVLQTGKMQIVLLATRKGILMRIMEECSEQLQKLCKHEQASTHLFFVTKISSKGQIFQALLNWIVQINTPAISLRILGEISSKNVI